MSKGVIWYVSLLVFLTMAMICHADQAIVAKKVDKVPVIDGFGNDSAWEKATALITHDKIADIDVTLKAVYTDKEIFFLVIFPDADESRQHKQWVWDKDSQMYKQGLEREDTFVFKWNMGLQPVDLSVYSEEPYVSDIWFWKACRTDPAGFADDKIDVLSLIESPKTMKISSKSGHTMYLQRSGDEGEPVYKDTLPVEYLGDVLPNFKMQAPTRSRADIRAKGIYSDGKWTIEFARALNTGNMDDIQFVPDKSFQFGISRHEIAGRKPDYETTQPFYGAGDISEELSLSFSQ